ncbi:MAG: MerR family transcriptional regulator [Oscillospiraceae bacterium]|nr:MerR family transcriptional regulator [Oscillospiraceae bacterium]
MLKTYKTATVAEIIGVHPNTVRFYEEIGFIPKPKRQPNGYRIFTDVHVEQMKLIRLALQVELLQNGLREAAFEIIKTSATGNIEKAENLAIGYLNQIKSEQEKAEKAIILVKQLLSGKKYKATNISFTRKQAAEHLQITADTLRNWELNGLLKVKRKENGYRVYGDEDIRLLKIIRTLRTANYSLSAILRLLNELSRNPQGNIKKIIDTPNETDDIISVCDKLLTSLKSAEENAKSILAQLDKMKKKK